MSFMLETSALAAPGYAGFVPNMKYQIGQTFGNSTKHIVESKPKVSVKSKFPDTIRRDSLNSQSRRKLTTGDDRFSAPLVTGYTGYVPRLQEHFGRSYLETTSAAIEDFKTSAEKQNYVPPKVQEAKQRLSIKKGASVKKQQKQQEQDDSTFISGYTGYIPQIKNHFGKSVRKTLEDGDLQGNREHKETAHFLTHTHSTTDSSKPIPGFTGHIPGSKYQFATTYGKLQFEMPEDHDAANDEIFLKNLDITGTSSKSFKKNLPIPGYMGHIPGYAFTAEKPFGQNTRACLKKYQDQLQ